MSKYVGKGEKKSKDFHSSLSIQHLEGTFLLLIYGLLLALIVFIVELNLNRFKRFFHVPVMQ